MFIQTSKCWLRLLCQREPGEFLGGPAEETEGAGDRKREQGSLLPDRETLSRPCSAEPAHEVLLVRKTALLSITQYLSVLTALEEIVCTHENNTHAHSVGTVSCLT